MLRKVQEIRIPAGDFSATASVHGKGSTAVVLGHGAGGDRHTAMLVDLAETLAGSGRLAEPVLCRFARVGLLRQIATARASAKQL